MQQVVDASVVAKWFLPEAHKDKAETLLRDFQKFGSMFACLLWVGDL
jgi:predicted nucleic acid-binding protein